MAFQEFLQWLAGNGIKVAVGWILFMIAEYWHAYQSLSAKAKRLVFAGVSLIIPLIAVTVGVAFGYGTWDFEQTFWPALQAGFLVFLSGTVSHTLRLKDDS